MNRKILTATTMAAALLGAQVETASADAFVGGLVGGFLGATLGSQAQRPRSSGGGGVSSAARQLARDVQAALNHFYFDAGVPDGVLGRQSRAAISQYQAYMGFGVSGELAEFERQVLITAWQRSQLGGAQVIQVTQNHQDGLRGLLPTVRDELLGIPARPVVEAAAPAPQAPATGLPSFTAGAGAGTSVSLASHCNRVALVTSANGGFATPETMTDPVFALNEQFCLARGYAIAEGEAMVAQIAGATPGSIAQQCAGLEGVMQPHVAALAVQPRDTVVAGVTQFVLTSGMSTEDLTATGRICLSSGYLTDNMTVALGSALILVALGETSYGELPGHHLVQGIGTAQRRELGGDWLRSAVPAGMSTVQVMFQPGTPDRNRLIHAAVDGLGGSAGAAPAIPVLTIPTAPAVPAAPSK